MTKVLKGLGFAVAVVLVLSITIGERTIFGHIYSVISPVTVAVQDTAESVFSAGYRSTSAYTKKLFDNSTPRADSVRSKLSALKKDEPAESITVQEKQQLDELIKTHR